MAYRASLMKSGDLINEMTDFQLAVLDEVCKHPGKVPGL